MLTGYQFWKQVLHSPKYAASPLRNKESLPFHLLCRQYGVTLCYSAEYSSNAFLQDTVCRESFTAISVPNNRPLIVQFCSRDTETFLSAAKVAMPHCDAVQLNLDCQPSVSYNDTRLAHMISDWSIVEEILKKASKELVIPIACKIKVLFNSLEGTFEYARKLESLGCSFLVIHGSNKRRKDLPLWDLVKQIKHQVSIPVIIQTDIFNFEDVKQCFQCTGADAILVSESLVHNPAVFTGTSPFVWDIAEKYLSLAEQCDTPMKHVKSYLFKMLQYCLQEYPQIRIKLAMSNSIPQFYTVCHMLRNLLLPLVLQHSDHTSGSGSTDICLDLILSRMHVDSSRNNEDFQKQCSDNKSFVKGEKEDTCDSINALCGQEENYSDLCLSGDIHVSEVDTSRYTLPVWFCHSRPKILQNNCGCCSVSINVERPLSCMNGSCENSYISKNCLRKIKHHNHVLKHKRSKRKLEKLRRKQRIAEMKQSSQHEVGHQAKVRDSKVMIRERLLMARGTAPRICVDFSFCYLMSEKEMNRLASQLHRLYGSNRKSTKPLHLYFTSISTSDHIYEICCRKNDGFADYVRRSRLPDP